MRAERRRWGAMLVVVSAAVLALDIVTGPFIQFPIMFVAPVGLGAWYMGRRTGIGFAVALVACRLAIAIGLEVQAAPAWTAFVNAGIRLMVLVGLAVLLDQVAWHRRTLAARVHMLEGILPICAFCKRIRRTDGTWEPVEKYVSDHSAVKFSHSYCEACANDRYPEFLAGRDARRPTP